MSLSTLGMLWTVACSAYANGDLLPLSEGNTWEYTGNGQKLIQKVEKAEGQSWILSTSVDGREILREWVTVDRNGIKVEKEEGANGLFTYPEPILALQLPVKRGERWSHQFVVNGHRVSFAFTVEGQEAVRVPAGVFEAILVSSRIVLPGGEIHRKTWYAEGVGVVKRFQEATSNGRTTSATSELERFQTKGQADYRPDPETATLMLQAENHLAKDELAEAEEAYGKAIAREPRYGFAWYSRAFVRSFLKKYPEAIEDANEALKLDFSRGSVLFLRGKVYFELRDYAKARPDLEEALRLLPVIEEDVRPMLRKIEEGGEGRNTAPRTAPK